jgi:hypothetical protein
VRVSNPIRSGVRKSSDGLLDAVAASFDQITHDEVASSVEAVVAVDTNQIILAPVRFRRISLLLILADLVDEVDEPRDFGVCRGYLRHRWKLMVFDRVAKAFRVIHGISVTYVDDIFDFGTPGTS